jgi:hypothetical protein
LGVLAWPVKVNRLLIVGSMAAIKVAAVFVAFWHMTIFSSDQ